MTKPKEIPDPEQFIKIPDLARQLEMSDRVLRRQLVKAGVRIYRFTRPYRVTKKDAARFIENWIA